VSKELDILKQIAFSAKKHIELENYALWVAKPEEFQKIDRACDKAFDELSGLVESYESTFGRFDFKLELAMDDPIARSEAFYKALCKTDKTYDLKDEE
jgi:hypothetical protein